MIRRFFLVALLTVVSVGFAAGQATTHTKVYSVPGAADGAVAEFETQEQLSVLDDFMQSKYLEKYDHALLKNDKDALDSMISDHAVWVGERFGKGEHLNKAGVLASFGDKNVIHVYSHTRDHVRLRALGKDVILMTSNSTSVLTINGKPSNTNRMGANIYMKLDGRWQCVLHSLSDYDGLLPGSKP